MYQGTWFWSLAVVLSACGRFGYSAVDDLSPDASTLQLTDDFLTVGFASPPDSVDALSNDGLDRRLIARLELLAGLERGFSVDDRGTPADPTDDEVVFAQPEWAYGTYEATYRVSLIDGRSGSARILVTVPCMSADESVAGEIRVEAVERYAVVFEEARFWEVARWYDLQYDRELDLGGNDAAGQMKLQVLHQLIAIEGPVNWVNIGSGPAERPTILESTPERVRLRTRKILRRDGQAAVFLEGVHVFRCDGTWEVSAELTPDAPSMRVVQWEYAMTTANPQLSWIESTAGGALRWELAGAGPVAPSLEVYPDPTYPEAMVASEEAHNLYFILPDGNYPISPSEPLVAAWRNIIWRPW